MGRRSTYGRPAKPITATVRPVAVDALRAESERQGRSIARLAADAIEEYLAARVDGFEPVLRPDCPSDQLELEDRAA